MTASTPVLPLWAARVIRFSLPPLVLVAAVLGVLYFDRTGQSVTRNAVYVGVVLL